MRIKARKAACTALMAVMLLSAMLLAAGCGPQSPEEKEAAGGTVQNDDKAARGRDGKARQNGGKAVQDNGKAVQDDGGKAMQNGMDEADAQDAAAQTGAEAGALPGLIEEQSFEAELGEWGTVTFASFVPETGSQLPMFALLRGGETVYTFPKAKEQGEDTFVRISAVSFIDYNEDGKKDIAVLTEYTGESGSFNRPQIFLQENTDNMFYLDYPDAKSGCLEAPAQGGPSFYRDTLLEDWLRKSGRTGCMAELAGTWPEYTRYMDGFAGGTQDIETQIRTFAEQRKTWIGITDWPADEYYFTLADLDYDGLLELIVSRYGGTGHYTYSCFYRTEDNGQLKELETSFTEGDSQPDLVLSPMTVYESFSKDGICDHYIVYDDLKISAMEYIFRFSSICVKDGRVEETPLAVAKQWSGINSEDQMDSVEVYEDCNGNSLTEEEFERFPDDYYGQMGLIRKTAFFQWEEISRIEGVSDEEAQEILTEVYEAFSVGED